MRGSKLTLACAALLLCLWLLTARAANVPCTAVISQVNRLVSAQRGAPPNLLRVARALGTSPTWVEHCMRAYGRRPKRTGYEGAEARAARLEKLESDEPEESGPEDVSEPGARERPERVERERQLHLRPTPTPAFWGGD